MDYDELFIFPAVKFIIPNMAKKLKDYYGRETAELITLKIKNVYPAFDTEGFVEFVLAGISDKEFLGRQDVYVEGFERFLPKDYSRNISLFSKILGPELKTETGMFTEGYWLWPIGRYVEKYGTIDWDRSVEFIYELTKRYTGEYAIRPLLENKPAETMSVLLKWSKDKNVHVRRLASEGGRINLPWSKKSLVCLQEFKIYKKILSNLKDDPSKFVQKSVGNNLNDLYKNDKTKAMEIISEWKKSSLSPAAEWIIKHGLRSESKK